MNTKVTPGDNSKSIHLEGTFSQRHRSNTTSNLYLDWTLSVECSVTRRRPCGDYLDPGVVKNLEDFAQRGGLVLLTGDSTVQIKGATKLNAVADW